MIETPVAVIGAGPAGLIGAEILIAAGKRVLVYERMPSVGRKLLMAGRGGLNLTHSEPFASFVTRYGGAAQKLRPMLDAFTPSDLIAWAEGLGQATMVGSSGRVFPKTMKASPLLRAWLTRLAAQGVGFRTRMRWTGWDGEALRFSRDDGVTERVEASATLLALGGASWAKLGSDGSWANILSAHGVALAPFAPSNVGYKVAWSDHFRTRFAGQPLKGAAFFHSSRRVRGDAMITEYGIEGSPIYALGPHLRATAPTTLHIDLRADLSRDEVLTRLARAKTGDTRSSTLRKSLGLNPLAISLLHENQNLPHDRGELAALIKSLPITLIEPCGIERAISTAGGVAWAGLDDNLGLKLVRNTAVAGEMLDWDAPTGGYLMQAAFATGVWAARGLLGRN